MKNLYFGCSCEVIAPIYDQKILLSNVFSFQFKTTAELECYFQGFNRH